MRLLDLFSGIGGFSLGLERAGFRTAAFCEIDPWCRRVLAKHWPGVPCYDDVRTVTADRLRADGIGRIDAICGGFPCQDISLAGKGAGLDGERSGLWREYARLLGELRPRYAIVENVGALRARGLADVLGDFAALGFDAEWHAIPAAAVGAPHLRDRVWIVAALADADGPGLGERRRSGLHRAWEARSLADECGSTDPDPDPDRDRVRIEPGWRETQLGAGAALASGDGAEGAAAYALCRGSPQLRGLFGRLARALAAAQTPWEWTTQPALHRLDDGIPRDVVRHERAAVKALGNAVVPQIPEIIGRALLEAAP